MNEIEASNDLEILQRSKARWELAKVEPFIQSAQQDVVNPDWKKLHLPVNAGGNAEAISDGGSFLSFNVIYNGQRALVDLNYKNLRFV